MRINSYVRVLFSSWLSLFTRPNRSVASSFEAVFETIKYKPKWIRIISDNGAHYHSSELMAIIAHWNEWYQIEVRDWQFLESGEAKITIDSHHAR